ncbi:MAG: lysylphosphatidylglycerol synthase transmembrane domain-containing protein [Terriglobia bacterium]
MSTQTEPLRRVERTGKVKSWAIVAVTSLISLACLWWVLSGAALPSIWSEIQHMHWGWVVLAIACDVCVYLLHGWRWKLLLHPVAPVRFTYAVEAIYVGLFANEVLPFRAGELIRCFLLSKSAKLPLSVTFASAVIERIFDGVWLMACFFLCLRLGQLPGLLVKGGYLVGIVIVVAGIAIACGMYAKTQSLDHFFGLRWPRWFNTLLEDLHLIGHSRYLYFAFLGSGAYMLAQILPIYALVKASSLPVPWTASFVAMVLLRLSSVVPQAPGNLGSFQWVAAHTMMMFGLAAAHAKRFSLILWAVLTLPLVVIGFLALAIAGFNLSHLHREATEAAAEAGKKRRSTRRG